MLPRPQLRLFSTLALLFAIVHATWLDANVYGRELDARQEASGISDPDPSAAGTGGRGPATSTTPPPPPAPTSTPPPPSASASVPPVITPSTRPSANPTTLPAATPSSAALSTPSSTSAAAENTPPTSSAPETTARVTPTPTTFVVVSTLVRTQDGSTISELTSSTVTSTLPTGTAALNGDGSSGPSSGMSSRTRSTIIGVVVGIGGAILLAGLGVVAFRIWGRRKNSDESGGFMSFGNPGHEKPASASAIGNTGANPFTSTLENYHNPARDGNVNASSNF